MAGRWSGCRLSGDGPLGGAAFPVYKPVYALLRHSASDTHKRDTRLVNLKDDDVY